MKSPPVSRRFARVPAGTLSAFLSFSFALSFVASAIAGDAAASPERPVEVDVGGGGGEAWFFGVCLSRSGPNANKGEPCIEGIRQRLREINEAGGFEGKPFRLLVADDTSTAEGAVAAARALLDDDRILAVIGPQVSGIAQATRDEAVDPAAKMIFVSPTATRDGLVKKDGWFFSALWPDSTQAEAMASYLAGDMKFERGTVIIDPLSLYSVGLGERFRQAFEKRGGRTAEARLPADAEGELPLAAFEPIVREVAAADPQFVYFPGTAGNIGRFVRQAGRAGLPPAVLLCGGDTWDNQEIFKASGSRLEGSVLTTPFFPGDPDERVVRFTRAMARADVTVVSLDNAMGYDAATMLAEAMKLGAPTRAGIREGWFKLRGLPLVSGDTSVREDGVVVKDTMILRIVATETGYVTERVKRVALE